MQRHRAWTPTWGLFALALTACGDDGPPASETSTGEATSTGADTTGPGPGDTTETLATSDASTTTDTSASESSTGSDELPDYSNSPCWGEAASTSVYNGKTHMLGDVATTCRAEGDRVLVYVADELWGSAVDQDAINHFMHQLEIFTPAGSVDPMQGVILNDEAVFGPMDVDAFPQGKLEIHVVDTNGGGDGYLCGWCDYPQLHMDGLLLQPLDDPYSIAIAAHETYHVIHHAHDTNEALWVDESLAEAAMTANGFFTDVDWLDDFISDPDQNWGPGNPPLGGFNYGAALLWGTFLWERGGIPLMTAITAEPTDGWEGLDAALAAVGDDRAAWDLYLDMTIAIYLDDPALGHGFASFDVPPVAVAGELMVGSTEMGALSPYGIDYHRITDTGDLTVGLVSTGAEPVVGQAVIVSAGAIEVVPLAPATAVSVGAGDSAFVVLTARDAATYDLSVD